ncbi:thioredoxin domain-containing protein 11 [Parasteatoda tepidariorum]|uniref:thioredoxin domain-containing protein 11 n=1 Tax=Parasteatoda tepidariorum TaxID=114398 RepID=UPI001C7269EE|nr:thioredoxin domain-containing protein 11 [Parasteatoda tepidariorum]
MASNDTVKDEDDIKIQETRAETPPPIGGYLQVMNSYGREIFFVIAIVFTGIAALQNSPLKTKKANPPKIFFEPPSLVTDFYTGNFKNLYALISEKDVSLIIYYAPWDATSMQAKEEVETVARFYHNEVFFAAINCWWPEGECRKKFTIHSYPIVLVNVHEFGLIRYEGPVISTYIISFLDYVLSPLVPLHHYGELLDLLTKHEGVLVAYLEFKDGSYPDGYKQFYYASLNSLTADPYRRICFAVVTNRRDATNLKLKSVLQLFLWNSTEIYNETSIEHAEVIKWAYSKLQLVTQWVSPPGAKSTALSEKIEKNPTVILFTPRNLLLDHSPYYNLFKEVALDYSNCEKTGFIESLVHRMVLQRHIMQEEFSKSLKKCHKNDTKTHPNICSRRPDLCDLTCCQNANFNLKFNTSCSCRVCLHHVVKNVEEMKLSECENTLHLILKKFNIKELGKFKQCRDMEVSFPVKFGQYKQLSFHCEDGSKDSVKLSRKQITEKEIAELKDDLILTMIQNNEKRLCHRLRYALNYSELNFPNFPASSDRSSWLSNFTGLGCRTNRSLTFIAMDTVLFHSFAENLGIDVSNNLHQTTAVIIESAQESQFVLNGLVNKKTLVEFIRNYTDGSLSRDLRMPIRKLKDCKKDDNSNVCVDEVTTATFFDIVFDQQDVILYYYASWCGACKSISHIYLRVADYFSNVEGIKFVRINGEENDLPWEYTVEKYPTIIFFPAKRKADSVEFPAHMEITLTNLLHFVLIHSQPKVRWLVSMEMCNRDCVAHNLIMSAKEQRRLYRELKILTNDLHFAQKVIHELQPGRSAKISKDGKKPNINYLKTVYISSVIERIHKKRLQIWKAQELQMVLRKKRDIYLRDAKDSDSNNVEKGTKHKKSKAKQKKAKDEL